MTAALWILAGSILLLAAVIAGCFLGWQAGAGNRFDAPLTDEEVSENLRPTVAWRNRNEQAHHDEDT